MRMLSEVSGLKTSKARDRDKAKNHLLFAFSSRL